MTDLERTAGMRRWLQFSLRTFLIVVTVLAAWLAWHVHAVEMFRLLGGGVFGDTPAGLPAAQLAVLPGTSHVTLVDRADLLLAIIPPFLDAPEPLAE